MKTLIKSWSLYILILLFFTQSMAQSKNRVAYYDAITLSKIFEKYKDSGGVPINPKTWEILQFYFTDIPTAITNISNNNPFLKNYFKIGGSSSLDSDAIDVIQQGLSLNSSGLKGLNVTTVADGLAKFLVERTKQELSVAFFDRLKKVFQNYPEFKLLFPNTHENLLIIDSYNFSAYLSTLRTGFIKDVDNLTVNLAEIKKLGVTDCNGATNKKCKERIKRYKTFFDSDKGRLFSTSLVLIQELKNGTNPTKLITTIANDRDFNNLKDDSYFNIIQAVKLGDFISKSLLSAEEDQIWVPLQKMKELTQNKASFKIYLGLLYQQKEAANITFKTDKGEKSFRDILKDSKSKIDNIESYIENIVADLNQVNVAVKAFKELKKSGDKPESKNYFQFYNGIVSFISNTSNFDTLDFEFDSEQKEAIKKYIGLANAAGNIYEDLTLNNYSSAIMNIRIFLQKTELEEREFYQQFLKYGTFMASVAEAENSDQVQQVIESIALPAGSSSIKRATKTNISLNAYLGVAYGEEYNGDTDKTKNIIGMVAPVGIAISKGLSYQKDNKRKELGSASLFLSLIDIGAVTNFRLNDNETEELPEIKLENIFAPGAYFVYGLPKWPLSIGAGAQYGPQLRTVTGENINLNSKSSFSFKVFLAVDIPLLNFYTKSR